MNTGNASTVDCGVCCSEVPLDAAFTPEGIDYVVHFCGLDCYRRFTERATHDRTSNPGLPAHPSGALNSRG
ncbi:MAG: DUF3330 domain-containing protein [Paraburkholderia sp.]|uniref:DUF3330 domain-containing protein n=1 Tax=Paraburkholderia sp. TaxID=1926495 RepID=UPI0012058C35|nr:DUF3330 domain-containing protein [Paraburkholderia sp.]TAM00974.1 MAG: DUF3330 domain-containing protein [Paraburkholderia sp.]